MICPQPHSYLVKSCCAINDFNPRIITRALDKELSVHTGYRTVEPSTLKLSSSLPITFAPNYNPTRARIGFGRWGLPVLKKQLHSEDILTVMQALNSIHDLIHNPEKAFEAIRIGLVDRMADMMVHEKDFVREKICMIFFTIAGLEAGKRAIIHRYKTLKNLALLLEDKVEAVSHKAQLVLEMISLSPIASAGLNCADYFILLLRLVGGSPRTENEDILVLHLATLKNLLDRNIKIGALKNNAMNIFIEKTSHEKEEIRMLALDCIALLCHHPLGRKEGSDRGLGLILCKKLFDESVNVRIKAAGALAFATIRSETRRVICKKCTINNLVEIFENFHSSEGQIMAAKTLSNLCEDPMGKSLVQTMQTRIKNVYTGNDKEVQRHKSILINMLKKK